jgi:hypothetical protein
MYAPSQLINKTHNMFFLCKYWLTSWETKWYCGMELWQWGWNVKFLLFLHPTPQPAIFIPQPLVSCPSTANVFSSSPSGARLVELSQHASQPALWSLSRDEGLLSEIIFVAKWLFSSACAQTGLLAVITYA